MHATPASADARALLLREKFGVLATISLDPEGYPFGSVVPYCLTRQGLPLILIADIAHHTRNLEADPRLSLTVLDGSGREEAGDIQSHARLTVLAEATRVPEEGSDDGDRYYRYFPHATDYHATHRFSFYRLEPSRLRYIGGFGDIRWIEPHDFLLPNPFDAEQETGILGHMNDDHQQAMRAYLSHFKQFACDESHEVRMVGIDAEGFDLLAEGRLHRFDFEEPIADAGQARERLVAMAHAAGA